jgi:hypothetical protein
MSISFYRLPESGYAMNPQATFELGIAELFSD